MSFLSDVNLQGADTPVLLDGSGNLLRMSSAPKDLETFSKLRRDMK
jgi:hypothetical protein